MSELESELKRIYFSFAATRGAGFGVQVAHGVSSLDTDDDEYNSCKTVILDKLREIYPPSDGWDNHDVILINLN